MNDQQVAPVHPDNVMKALAVRGLRGAQVSVADLAAIDHLDPRSFVGVAEATRMLGPMLGAVHDGELDFDDDSTRYLIERHEANMLWAIKLEARILEMRDLFAVRIAHVAVAIDIGQGRQCGQQPEWIGMDRRAPCAKLIEICLLPR